jgi:hypothetical protein
MAFFSTEDFEAHRRHLLRQAFVCYLSAERIWNAGREVASELGLDADDQEARFWALYEGDEEASMNAAVHGHFHDADNDEHLAECYLEDLDNLDNRAELAPL